MSEELREFKPNIDEAMKLADGMAKVINERTPDKDDEKYHTVIMAQQICQMSLLFDMGMPADMIADLHKHTMLLLVDSSINFLEGHKDTLDA